MGLGLPDPTPHITRVEWAIEDVFSGSGSIPRIVADRTTDVAKAATLRRLAEAREASATADGYPCIRGERGSGLTAQSVCESGCGTIEPA
jgi:hypothetical protein